MSRRGRYRKFSSDFVPEPWHSEDEGANENIHVLDIPNPARIPEPDPRIPNPPGEVNRDVQHRIRVDGTDGDNLVHHVIHEEPIDDDDDIGRDDFDQDEIREETIDADDIGGVDFDHDDNGNEPIDVDDDGLDEPVDEIDQGDKTKN